MTIICSCGHKVGTFEETHNVIQKGYTRRNEPCLEYRTICDACFDDELCFDSEEDAHAWLEQAS